MRGIISLIQYAIDLVYEWNIDEIETVESQYDESTEQSDALDDFEIEVVGASYIVKP
jgi:hypothetical protein